MKSERRHELQHNVLDQKLSDVLDVLKKYGNYLAWGVLLVAVVVLLVVWVRQSRAKEQAALQIKFDTAMTELQKEPDARLNQLTELTNQDRDKFIAVQASLAVADEYADRIAAGTGRIADKDLKDYAVKAGEYYSRVVNAYADFPAQVAKAHIGLAKLAENAGDFDQAGKEYSLATKACPAQNPIVLLANEGLQRLATLKQPVKMATTAPATQPASAPASRAAATTPPGATAPAKSAAPAGKPAK
jgi:hypothetical protein